jgi:hypothetical protein
LRRRKAAFARLDVDGQAGMSALNAEKHGERNGNKVILVLAKNTTDSLHDADDHELIVADANASTDGVDTDEKFLHQGIADQANVGAMFGFGGDEVAAGLHRAGVNIGHAGSLAVKTDVLRFLVAITGAHGSAGGGAHFLASGASFGDRAHVVQLNFLVLERFDDDVEIGDGKRSAGDLEHVGAEIGDFVFHVEIRALHDGHYGDERSHTHGETNHGEGRAQFVGAHGAQALREIVLQGEHWAENLC